MLLPTNFIDAEEKCNPGLNCLTFLVCQWTFGSHIRRPCVKNYINRTANCKKGRKKNRVSKKLGTTPREKQDPVLTHGFMLGMLPSLRWLALFAVHGSATGLKFFYNPKIFAVFFIHQSQHNDRPMGYLNQWRQYALALLISLASGHNRDGCRWRPFIWGPPLIVKNPQNKTRQSYVIKWLRWPSSHCGVKTNYIIWSPSKSHSMLCKLPHLYCCWCNGKSQEHTTWFLFSSSSCPHIVMPQSSGCSGAFSESVR